MVQRSVPERLSASSTDTETLAFRVSEISSAVDAAIETALRYAQEKAGVGDLNLVMKKLQGGDVTAWQYFNYCLAQQVSEYLGACDSHVQATYTFDYDATPEDVIFSDQVRDRLIHILIWVSRRTPRWRRWCARSMPPCVKATCSGWGSAGPNTSWISRLSMIQRCRNALDMAPCWLPYIASR